MYIKQLIKDIEKARDFLESHAARLNSLDVKRHNGAGIKRHGFIERAKDIAENSQEFLPHWLTQEKFERDYEQFADMRMALNMIEQMRRLAENIFVVASDMAYTDALEYYASVREAAKRRINPAETIHSELSVFFKSCGSWARGKQTQKKLMQDVNSLLHGEKDGVVVVENVSPKD